MTKDATTPATKADLDAFEERILKAFGTFKAEMDKQFHFIAEKLTEIFIRLDGIDARLDVIETRLDAIEERLDSLTQEIRGEIHPTVLGHEERLKRLERFAGFSS